MAPVPPSRRRSCASCVRAKAKCQASDRKNVCGRCARLGQHCSPPGTPRLDQDRLAPAKKDRLDLIQDRLDALITHLSDSPTTPSCAPRSPAGLRIPPPIGGSNGDVISREILSEAEAERSLQKFRSRKMALFPFVVIPPTETLATLRHQSPFLLLAILGASQEDNSELQGILDAEVRNVVALRVVLQAERNMDLLLGLLVHVAWHHYYWESMHPQQCMFLNIASGMIADLGLDGQTSYTMPAGYSSTTRLDSTLLPAAYQQSASGKRAVLGYYYLCSIMSIFRVSLAVNRTRQIDEHCASLFANPEHPTDPLLRVFVDGHSLSRAAGEKSSQNDGLAWDSLSLTIDEAHAIMKADLTQHGLYINGAALLGFKAMHAFAGISYLRYLKKSFGVKDFRSVQAILISARSTITAFLELPDTVVVDLPITSHITVWYSLLILCKLTVLAPSTSRNIWNDRDELGRSQARQLALAVVNRFGSFSRGGDFWLLTTRVMGSLVPWLDERVEGSNISTGSVTFPHPIDCSGGSGPIPHTTMATNSAYESRGWGIGSSPSEGTKDQTPDTSASQAPASSMASHARGVDGVDENEMYWDEGAWQQMMVDFAVFPNLFST